MKPLSVGDYCSVALDSGEVDCVVMLDGDGEPKQHPTGRKWHFWFEEVGKMRTLVPQNGTRFAKPAPVEFGKAGCQAATFKSGRLRVDQLPAGSHVCVQTRSGRYAELILNVPRVQVGRRGSSPNDLQISYIFFD